MERYVQKAYNALTTKTLGQQTRTFSRHVETAGSRKYSGSEFQTVDRQNRRRENQTCCDEHVVQSVDGQLQIASDGDRQRRKPGRNNQRGTLVLGYIIPETTVNSHSKLV